MSSLNYHKCSGKKAATVHGKKAVVAADRKESEEDKAREMGAEPTGQRGQKAALASVMKKAAETNKQDEKLAADKQAKKKVAVHGKKAAAKKAANEQATKKVATGGKTKAVAKKAAEEVEET